jgi:serine protease AprX
VAGIIAGADGSYRGVAPGANLINLRALGADGSGTTSDVMEAITWVRENQRKYRIRVLNLSLGHPVWESWRDDPLVQEVERAAADGIVVVVSAGNQGINDAGQMVLGSITSPGNAPHAITVGALNTKATAPRSDDSVTTYSSRGPTAFDAVLKPDLVAPGNKIVSAASPGSYITTTFPDQVVDGSYITLSGTSMAAAVVSGAVAVLLEAHKDMTPEQVKIALQLTASFVPDAGLIGAGAGSLNLPGAVLIAGGAYTLNQLPQSQIASETVSPQGIAFALREPEHPGYSTEWTKDKSTLGQAILWTNSILIRDGTLDGRPRFLTNVIKSNAILWTAFTLKADAILWTKDATKADAILWTKDAASADAILWTKGAVKGDAILWTKYQLKSDAILWTKEATKADAILWTKAILWTNGTVLSDAILWTNAILWTDAILWTKAILWTDAILWTKAILWTDAILWTNAILWTDAILWTNAILWTDAILWTNGGPNSDAILWTNNTLTTGE